MRVRHRLFVPPRWLLRYRAKWLKYDLIAGVTLAAYAIPVSLAYAALAGLPPQVGLYCYLVGGLGYLLLGSSRHLAIGPTSAISLVVGVTLGRLAQDDPNRLMQLAGVTSLMVAGACILAWLLRLSVMVNFISESILVGFKAGAAVAIAATQLPKFFGVPGGGDSFFARVWQLWLQLGETNSVVVAVGLSAILLLLLGERLLPGRPVALAVVALSLVAVPFLGLTYYGVAVVGDLPSGLPAFELKRLDPTGLDTDTLRELLRLGGACFLLAYIESTSTARTFALRYRYFLDARQELLGLGAANLLTAVFQGYPSAGGLSQSAVNERAGARSPLALLFASFSIALVLLYLTGLLHNLPQAILAAIVLVALKGLVDIEEMRHLWRISRIDFYAALVAFLGVLTLGILDGVILALIASLLMLLKRSATPHVAFLGRIPGTSRFSDLARHPENISLPEVITFRVEAPILYFNADHVLRVVLDRVHGAPTPIKVVICDLSTSPYVDVAGARMLKRLHEELSATEVVLRFVEAHAAVRDMLRAEGLEELVGPISRRASLTDMLGKLGYKQLLQDPAG